MTADSTAAPRTLFLLGLYLGEERPRLADAAAALEAAWRLDPANVQAIYNAAVAVHQMGDMSGAERLYREGLTVHPQEINLRDALVTLLMQLERRRRKPASPQTTARGYTTPRAAGIYRQPAEQ